MSRADVVHRFAVPNVSRCAKRRPVTARPGRSGDETAMRRMSTVSDRSAPFVPSHRQLNRYLVVWHRRLREASPVRWNCFLMAPSHMPLAGGTCGVRVVGWWVLGSPGGDIAGRVAVSGKPVAARRWRGDQQRAAGEPPLFCHVGTATRSPGSASMGWGCG
jgi:hypothetical protein